MEDYFAQAHQHMLLELFSEKNYRPMKLKELCAILNVPRSEREDLKLLLDQMISEGQIQMTSQGAYKKLESDELTGTFSGNSRGFGFVSVIGHEEEGDVFIPEEATKGALHGDTVIIKITSEGHHERRSEGQVIRIVERGLKDIIGTFEKSKNYGFVIPDNTKVGRDIFVSTPNSKGAVTGHKVLVRITDYGTNSKSPEGKVLEILGHIDDPGTDVLSVIKANSIPVEFPEDIRRQLNAIPDSVTEADMIGRMDLRSWQTVTIDGEDAKDLDDAVTLTKEGSCYRLGVHIADVTHYVTENSSLDKEALKRGTSVYLVDRVIPMLPHELSNGICSLNAGVDRLALSCLMDIDEKGNVIGHQIVETIISVDRRMSYTEVNNVVSVHDDEAIQAHQEFVPLFERMKELSDILRGRRKQRGGIDFDFPESKIILDASGHPTEIKAYERNAATKIIEDFMLMANETIAENFFWQELPFLYRTHETPDMERIEKLMAMIRNFGYYLKVSNDEVHPKEVQKLLGKIQDTPEEAMISRLVLRSMKQARYTTNNIGHFGLAVKYYCHFTSPIRRYPDLQIHRIIKEYINGKLNEKRQSHYSEILPEVAVSTSRTERRAEEAEREVEKLKKVEYMADHIGEIYDGVISGLTNWGMYVELPNTCEGMIRLKDLEDDYYIYDEVKYILFGETTGKTFQLGEKIRIRVAAADKLTRTIDFRPEIDCDEQVYDV